MKSGIELKRTTKCPVNRGSCVTGCCHWRSCGDHVWVLYIITVIFIVVLEFIDFSKSLSGASREVHTALRTRGAEMTGRGALCGQRQRRRETRRETRREACSGGNRGASTGGSGERPPAVTPAEGGALAECLFQVGHRESCFPYTIPLDPHGAPAE